jgi:hypothetical protein
VIEKLLGMVLVVLENLIGLALLIWLLRLVWQSAIVADAASRDREYPPEDTQ